MENTELKRKKQYAKIILIVSCIFAVIASFLIIVSIYGVPQAIEYGPKAKYLYENGVEVDAHFKYYYDNYGPSGAPPSIHPHNTRKYSGRFFIVYEYVDGNGNTYTDEYLDTVECKSKDELRAREQYIKQMLADEPTMKMLIADNGLCCLSVYKESLLKPTTLVSYIIIISVSSLVLGLCIFGIVRQSKILRRIKSH